MMPMKETLSALIDGECMADELGTALARLRVDAASRDNVTVYQLIADALAGHRALDDGYTVRILARLGAQRAGGKPR
jgi:negative regulator of sigma E activity